MNVKQSTISHLMIGYFYNKRYGNERIFCLYTGSEFWNLILILFLPQTRFGRFSITYALAKRWINANLTTSYQRESNTYLRQGESLFLCVCCFSASNMSWDVPLPKKNNTHFYRYDKIEGVRDAYYNNQPHIARFSFVRTTRLWQSMQLTQIKIRPAQLSV